MSLPNPIVLLDARAKYAHPAFQVTRASTKTVFDAAGRMVTVPPNAIGWDHDPATGEGRGVLVEPAVTNRVLSSNSYGGANWSRNQISVTPNAIPGLGYGGMSHIRENATESGHTLYQDTVAISPGTINTWSVVLGAAERYQVFLWASEAGQLFANRAYAHVDLAAGSIVSTYTSGPAEMHGAGAIPLGRGLYRYWIAFSLGDGVTVAEPRIAITPDFVYDYQGDGQSGIYAGYAQFEQQPRPTSYIHTGGSTALRNRSELYLADLSEIAPAVTRQGTFLLDVEAYDKAGGGRVFQFNGTNNITSTTDEGWYQVRGLYGPWLGMNTVTQTDGRHVVAFTWDEDGGIAAGDGGLGGSVSGGPIEMLTPDLGFGLNSSWHPSWVRRLYYWSQRLPNAALQSLTAIQE